MVVKSCRMIGNSTVIRETGREVFDVSLDRGQKRKRLGGETRKYRRVFRGRGWRRRNGIVREQRRVTGIQGDASLGKERW